jgi:hypothetical protein
VLAVGYNGYTSERRHDESCKIYPLNHPLYSKILS